MTSLRGAPSTTRSSASVKSAICTRSWSRRAAVSAASLARLARSAPTMPAVDEDDGRLVAPRLLEEVAHARGADADDGLDELRRGRGEEGHAGLAGHRARKQRLAGAGRAREQHAAGHAAAQAGVAVGVAQEV